jgi:hypothetical protein
MTISLHVSTRIQQPVNFAALQIAGTGGKPALYTDQATVAAMSGLTLSRASRVPGH